MSTTKVIPARFDRASDERKPERYIKEVVCCDTLKPYPELQSGELFNKLASMMSSIADLTIEPLTTAAYKLLPSNHPMITYHIACEDTKAGLEHYVMQNDSTCFKLLVKNTTMDVRKFSIFWL